jgi:hypothetical protein
VTPVKDPENVRNERRALLKAAVATGVGAATYAAPKVSVVPAYAQTSLVSYTTESRVMCVWFSPNQETYGQWHRDQTGYTDPNNNYNPFTGVMGANKSWSCYPPAMRVPVLVSGTTRWVNFVGDPNNSLWAPTGANCTAAGSTVPAYSLVNATTPWSGGGVRITVEDPNCEMVVTGQALSGAGVLLNLGPYCRPQSGHCIGTNANEAPATWAQGSSTMPIGGSGCNFLAPTIDTRSITATITNGSTTVTSNGLFTPADVGAAVTRTGIPPLTTIVAFTNTSTVTISAPATTTNTGALRITRPPLPCAMTQGSQPNGNVGGGVFTGSAYYHTGRTGRSVGDRCKWGFLFVIRCRT